MKTSFPVSWLPTQYGRLIAVFWLELKDQLLIKGVLLGLVESGDKLSHVIRRISICTI